MLKLMLHSVGWPKPIKRYSTKDSVQYKNHAKHCSTKTVASMPRMGLSAIYPYNLAATRNMSDVPVISRMGSGGAISYQLLWGDV